MLFSSASHKANVHFYKDMHKKNEWHDYGEYIYPLSISKLREVMHFPSAFQHMESYAWLSFYSHTNVFNNSIMYVTSGVNVPDYILQEDRKEGRQEGGKAGRREGRKEGGQEGGQEGGRAGRREGRKEVK